LTGHIVISPLLKAARVAPETGGMSVALEKPGNLPKLRIPTM